MSVGRFDIAMVAVSKGQISYTIRRRQVSMRSFQTGSGACSARLLIHVPSMCPHFVGKESTCGFEVEQILVVYLPIRACATVL